MEVEVEVVVDVVVDVEVVLQGVNAVSQSITPSFPGYPQGHEDEHGFTINAHVSDDVFHCHLHEELQGSSVVVVDEVVDVVVVQGLYVVVVGILMQGV